MSAQHDHSFVVVNTRYGFTMPARHGKFAVLKFSYGNASCISIFFVHLRQATIYTYPGKPCTRASSLYYCLSIRLCRLEKQSMFLVDLFNPYVTGPLKFLVFVTLLLKPTKRAYLERELQSSLAAAPSLRRAIKARMA